MLPIDIGNEKSLIEKWLMRDNRKKVIVSSENKGLVRLANMNAKIQRINSKKANYAKVFRTQ